MPSGRLESHPALLQRSRLGGHGCGLLPGGRSLLCCRRSRRQRLLLLLVAVGRGAPAAGTGAAILHL
jgi:hypothetical protein